MFSNLSRIWSWSRRASIASFVAFAPIALLAGGQQPATAPYSADALFQSGKASLSQGKYQEAEEAFRKVYELEPGNARGLMAVTEVYVAQKKYDQAIRLLQEEANKYPSRLDYRLATGATAMRAGKNDLALQEFLYILNNLDKTSKAAGELYYRIGEVYRRKGQLDFSIIFLRQAKELLPENIVILNTLALTLDSTGQKEAATEMYKSALAVDPNNGGTLNNLAFLLCENGGNLDTALEYARRAQQLRPDSEAVADTLGWIYVKKNMTTEAIAILRDVVKKDPSRSTYRYHLALALEQKGDHSAATEELKTALTKNPPKDEEQKIQELLRNAGK